MKTILIAAVLSATAAFAAATWVYLPEKSQSTAKEPVSFDTDLPAAERLAALEQAVSQEQYARQLLQEEIIVLTDELESLRTVAAPVSSEVAPEASDNSRESEWEQRRARYAARNTPEARTERLVEAGIDPGLAGWIVQREQELQMDSLQARYDAGRSGDATEFSRERFSSSDALRQELGDENYERYLEANGRSTNVGVSSIIGSSPAQAAGLMPGDEIVRYDGNRVFSMSDITQATMTGEPGQNVVVDVMRDGLTLQMVMPRGPLGITSRRGRR
ncbi:MAG: PDZ domain-containing protein [Woeseiaceae bacterium]